MIILCQMYCRNCDDEFEGRWDTDHSQQRCNAVINSESTEHKTVIVQRMTDCPNCLQYRASPIVDPCILYYPVCLDYFARDVNWRLIP